jgi:hypothetical protein
MAGLRRHRREIARRLSFETTMLALSESDAESEAAVEGICRDPWSQARSRSRSQGRIDTILISSSRATRANGPRARLLPSSVSSPFSPSEITPPFNRLVSEKREGTSMGLWNRIEADGDATCVVPTVVRLLRAYWSRPTVYPIWRSKDQGACC